jgi:hypothetical protein
MSFLDDPEFLEISRKFNEAVDAYQKEADDFWNSLPYDDRLKLFCAVSKLIVKGEIEEKRSYRGILYDTFGFGPDAYVPAQCAGYMAIHNAIYDSEYIGEIIKDFVENHLDVTKDNLKEQIDKFIYKKHA